MQLPDDLSAQQPQDNDSHDTINASDHSGDTDVSVNQMEVPDLNETVAHVADVGNNDDMIVLSLPAIQ